MAEQTVDVGTELTELNLPDTVMAEVYQVIGDTEIPDEDNWEEENDDTAIASSSNAGENVSDGRTGGASKTDSGKTAITATTAKSKIPVAWDSAPAYDGDTEGDYVFTADVGDYALSGGAKLPQITVTVAAGTEENLTEKLTGEPLSCTRTEGCTLAAGHEGECVPEQPPANDGLVKTITSWAFVDDENLNEGELALAGVGMERQADFEAVASMLPTQIRGTIDGEAGGPATLGITGWSCPGYRQDGEGNWPTTGAYTFTAALPEGYVCDPLPMVKVLIGGADLYEDDYGGLTITGGTVTQGTDGQIKLQNGSYEISGTWGGTLTDVGNQRFRAVVTVPDGVSANVTLRGVNIDVGDKESGCAFAVEGGGTANITLSGTNVLSSGSWRAGLEVSENAKVTIGGDGSLTAESASDGAGIGGADSRGAGTIVITDNAEVKAMGGEYGAGIGSSGGGRGGTITINGNAKVTAEGGSRGAGIGGGKFAMSGDITISGNAEVRAMGTDGGAGIGGGANGASGNITINGNANVTAIGGDHLLDAQMIELSSFNGKIRIGGSAVVEAIGRSGSGIGAGGSTCDRVGGSGIGGSGIGTTVNNTRVEITGGTVVARGTSGTGIGGGSGIDKAGWGGSGGVVIISGQDTNVTASSESGADVGNGSYANDGSLSVTDGATLTLANNGTNVTEPNREYRSCTIIDRDGNKYRYGSRGFPMGSPALSLEVSPKGPVTYPATVTLTAIFSDEGMGNSGKDIIFTTGTATHTARTDDSGRAVWQVSDLPTGTYSFGASFGGDGDNDPASAAGITGYTVDRGTQDTLGITGLGSAYTYGCEAFNISVSGGSGSGAVSFVSSDPSVANVTGNTVTIHKVGHATVTATKAGDKDYDEATASMEITVNPRDIKNVTVNIVGSRIYTGSQLQPLFEVNDGGNAIARSDYTNIYGSNVAVGTDTGSITLTGQSNYTGTKTVRFDIQKRPLAGAAITLESTSYMHTGGEIRPAVTNVAVDGIAVSAAEYDVEYTNNSDVGTATVTITAKVDGNFSGSESTAFEITNPTPPAGSGSSSSGDRSSDSTQGRYFDAKKGWVDNRTGIITGSGYGYSRWAQDDTGWKLRYADGTMAVGVSKTAGDGSIYEYLTWELINGAWYAFGADGYAKSGMVFDPGLGGYFYIDINSGMKTGWQLIGGNWYYFNPVSDGKKGIMVTDAWIDGWYVDRNGIWNGNGRAD